MIGYLGGDIPAGFMIGGITAGLEAFGLVMMLVGLFHHHPTIRPRPVSSL